MSRRVALAAALALVAGATLTVAADPLGGDSAFIAPLAQRSLLLDADARGATMVAVGERGHVLVSSDRGATWKQVEVPTRALLTGVDLGDETTGWAVGHDEVILRTRDGGTTWELVRNEPDNERPLLDVWFRDTDHGFAVGAYGAFLVTEDGGTSWDERPIGEDDYHLNQIAPADDGTIYVAAEAGHLYRSDDGGETWTSLPSPYEGSYFGVLPLTDGGLLAFGLRGNLYRSEDRGERWQQISTGTEATLMAGLELADGEVLVAGLAGVVLRSDDSGRSFALEAFDDRRGHVAALAVDGEVVLFGEGGMRRLEARR